MQEQNSFRIEEYVDIFKKWFEILLYPSPDGLSIYFHDITEKKQAEQALLSSKKITGYCSKKTLFHYGWLM